MKFHLNPIPARSPLLLALLLLAPLLLAPLLLAMFHAPVALAAEPIGRPNIVFILADDLGYGDVECFGGDRCQIDTPAFDTLAAEGMRFTDAHAVASVCIPSRIGIMTGRYAWRFTRPNPSGPWGYVNPQFQTDQFTLGTMLGAAGYRTGYVGKWHLGTLMPTTDGKNQNDTNVDYSKPIQIGPPQYGFDSSFILPGSLDMFPYAFVRDNRWVGSVTARKGWSAFNRVGPAAEDFEDVKVLDTFSRQAARFIGQHADAARRGKPFFLYVALTAPHTPLSPRAAFQGKSRLGVYGDFVMETDDCIGRVMAALAAHGLENNTLLIATSDHGAAPYAGRRRLATPGQMKELEKDGHYCSGIYRGYKFSVYEGGFRVPYVACWPGVVPRGSTCDRLIGHIDLMATLAEVVGYDLNRQHAPDSISLLPLLKKPQAPPPRKSLVLQATRALAIRSGSWKLALCPGSGSEGRYGNTPPHQQAWRDAIAQHGQPESHEQLLQAPFVQLFNLDDDPGETANLAADQPERVQRMAALLAQHIDNGRSTPGPKLANDARRIKLFRAVPTFVWKKTDGDGLP